MEDKVIIMDVWVFRIIEYEKKKYDNGDYKYKEWEENLGWIID